MQSENGKPETTTGLSRTVPTIEGREWYLPVASALAGVTVQVDGDFTCIRSRQRRLICEDEAGLFIKCREGQHYLDGQISDCGEFYIGMRIVQP